MKTFNKKGFYTVIAYCIFIYVVTFLVETNRDITEMNNNVNSSKEELKQLQNSIVTYEQRLDLVEIENTKMKAELEIKKPKIIYLGINSKQLEDIIRRTLEYLGEKKIEEYTALLLYTSLIESNMGVMLKQKKGPALSIFQIEPTTEKSVWDIYLKRNPIWKNKIENLLGETTPKGISDLKANIPYSIAIAYLIYKWRDKHPPKSTDAKGIAFYHKKFYNTYKGKTKLEKGIPLAHSLKSL